MSLAITVDRSTRPGVSRRRHAGVHELREAHARAESRQIIDARSRAACGPSTRRTRTTTEHRKRILGAALRDAKAGEVFVATKVGMAGYLEGKPEGLGRATVLAACEQSLARLGMDRVDLYYLHKPDRDTPFAETLDALAELHRAGRIRALRRPRTTPPGRSWRCSPRATRAACRAPWRRSAVQRRHPADRDSSTWSSARRTACTSRSTTRWRVGCSPARWRRAPRRRQVRAFDAKRDVRGRYLTDRMRAFSSVPGDRRARGPPARRRRARLGRRAARRRLDPSWARARSPTSTPRSTRSSAAVGEAVGGDRRIAARLRRDGRALRRAEF
jgi:hypothetical protein